VLIRLQPKARSTDKRLVFQRPLGSVIPVLASCAALPVALLVLFGDRMVMPPLWVHFYGVGVSALVAMAAAATLTILGARHDDVRTVVVGGGFSLMAALLAVHGLVTPGVLVGPNGLVAVTGAATLPVGGAVLALSALPRFTAARDQTGDRPPSGTGRGDHLPQLRGCPRAAGRPRSP